MPDSVLYLPSIYTRPLEKNHLYPIRIVIKIYFLGLLGLAKNIKKTNNILMIGESFTFSLFIRKREKKYFFFLFENKYHWILILFVVTAIIIIFGAEAFFSSKIV